MGNHGGIAPTDAHLKTQTQNSNSKLKTHNAPQTTTWAN